VTRATASDVETETAVDTGNPAECIVDYAAATDVDLIVMGTSGDEYEQNVVGASHSVSSARLPSPLLPSVPP